MSVFSYIRELHTYVSIGFDAVAGVNVVSFTLKGVLPGKVHRITRAATVRSDLYMLQDAPGGLFVVCYSVDV